MPAQDNHVLMGVLSEMDWPDAIQIISEHKDRVFQFESVVHLDILLAEIQPSDGQSDETPLTVETAITARQIAREVRQDTGFRFMYMSSL